jgi:hypothetical protein
MKQTIVVCCCLFTCCLLLACSQQPPQPASPSPATAASPASRSATDSLEVNEARLTRGEDYKGAFTEERMICGNVANTPELHNVRCGGEGCHCIGDGKWCFRRTDLTVAVPSDKWVFSGAARVDCARNNEGSCEWNALGAPDRFAITLNNPTEIRGHVLTNSRSIGVRLCAPARYYP